MINTSLSIFILFVCLCSACSKPVRAPQNTTENGPTTNAININSATVNELRELPGIGDTLADRIVRFRQGNGPFSRVEQLMLVDGVSEKKFRAIRRLVRTQ